MTAIHHLKGRSQIFQTERRKVQRQVVQSVLLCGLVLIVIYGLIVIATGIFIVYTQFFSPEIISDLNSVHPQYFVPKKHVDERLLRDPVARLLQGKELNLQTFAPYEDYEISDEEKQIHEAAAVLDSFENSRIPLQLGISGWIRRRKLLSVEGEKVIKVRKRSIPCVETPKVKAHANSSDTFPSDLFTLKQRQHGAILLHFCGLCYMFVSLTIVCDEFFVPSLSIISEVLKISDDVAGATFMAAGGSAPEFFISVFGVFITSNNVGVGTIVGSATFNILFVLSFCTFFSKQVLHLTWYPMFRDMFFYVISLLLLLIIFMDEVVDWYEALILFTLYIIYGIFMKYNMIIERALKRRIMSWSASVNVERKVLVEGEGNGSEVTFLNKHLPIVTTLRTLPVLHSGAIFRTGLVNIAMDPGALTTGDKNSLHNEGPTTPSLLHPQSTKRRSTSSTRTSVPQIFFSNTSSQLQAGHNLENLNELPSSSRTTSSVWSSSTAISQSKLNANRQSINMSSLERSSDNGLDLKRISVEIQPERPIDLSWPSTLYKRCIYIILAPIMFPLYLTLPDVKKPNRRRLFLWTFMGSILWIALYSYVMVFMANTIGETFAIPSELMGLTILAAGTSIPDLITSVIVARKGLGDMAVSSSIGSNLFDICVGLPVPWLLHYLVEIFRPTFQRISVESNGLVCSIGMLFLMLVILYGTVALFGWKMSKKFGLVMILSYCVFCILSICLEVEYLSCPLKRLPTSISC